MDDQGDIVSRRELATLQHDLEGPLATFGGFLTELQAAVEALERVRSTQDAAELDALIRNDFRPCLDCLEDSLTRLRTTVRRLAPDEHDRAA